MYPTKSTYDYMTEINRLFPRTIENDVYRSPNTATNAGLGSPFQQTTLANHSSSSTDSMSPDYFPDMSHRSDTNRQAYETPFSVRRQRPIIGRKIFDNPERMPPTEPTSKVFDHDLEFPTSIWQPEDKLLFSQTPPNLVEQKNYKQNFLYELFPPENKGFELKSPISTLSPVSNFTNTPPSFSPQLSNASPISTKVCLPRMQPASPFRYPSQLNFGASSSGHQDIRPTKMCTFCRKNGETPLVYMDHTVKERVGNQNIVTCPILRSHVCSTCGATGDNAHTITYCPILRSSNNGLRLQSTTITLKNTRVKSNGRRRY